ncbi:MAG: CDP-archaeol synthase [Chromatiaceae bacterium]|nr:CDP-archaeol synthase [Gammaproteobacteria bacterium]MCP5427151.1 CDP-archaeol synthase [Chromatiaceae bacterium]MCB1861341.1 CDP-archaeol synthase [Gammaproteobacteria bacterium]MCB1881873.1 CDP-archaeol synthase [Gammaproteobacteria bacterium]MCB1905318.1 CDP-archaeol synthase [Gammaproteobacteria bacterium]
MEIHLLVLLFIANGSPILARRFLGERFGRALDGGRVLADGRPLLGASKTLRGIVSALLVTMLAAPLLGVSWIVGLLLAVFAMLGDLSSSFLKRRLGLQPSSMALGLDQIPESLLPLMVCRPLLELSWAQVLWLTLAFFVLELILSQLLYRLGIRKHPY